MTVTREEVNALMDDRPEKFSPEEVNYQEAPQGSAMRCAACFHMYRRATDNHTVCELIRSEEIDEEGINPAWRCTWFSADGDVAPLSSEAR